MRKFKPFVVLGIAVIIGLFASLLVYTSLQKKAKGKEAIVETQTIAVAKIDLGWGTSLTKEMIKMEPFLKSSLPAGTFPDFSNLVGRIIISPVKAEEPILESRLAPTSLKTGGVAAIITPKKRAVAVKVDKVIGVAGFVHPGNRVDVLVTIPKGKTEVPTTKTVLENILVLAAGPEVEIKGKGKEEKASLVDVITLEVAPEEAEKLALAATEGKLQLALRNFTDTEEVVTRGISIPTMLGSYSGSALQTKSKAKDSRLTRREPPAQPSFVAELIRGGKISTVKLEGGI